jgi:ectoine hydroxylase-related dioxygenase (phytanoyl-CoA dioxygenase family)
MPRVDLTALDHAGHLLVPDVLAPATVERLRRAFATDHDTGTEHVEISDDTPDAADWRALADHPVLLAAAAHVLGPEFHAHRVHGRNPRPGHGQQGLHADWQELAPGEPFHVLTAIWLLDEFTAANGATRIVPGTHRLRRPVPRPLAQPLAHHPDEQIVTGPAGAVLLLNGHLWHSGRRNESAGPRRAAQQLVMRGPPA